MNNWIGKNRAATTPPALKSVQKIGSVSRFTIVSLCARNDDGKDNCGDDDPCQVLWPRNEHRRHALAANANCHCLRSQIEPGNRVQQEKGKGNDIKCNHPRITHAVFESQVSFWAANQCTNLKQYHRHSPCHRHTTQFAKDEFHVSPLAQPPVSRNLWAVPTRMKFRVRRRGRRVRHCGWRLCRSWTAHRFSCRCPQGMRNCLMPSMAPASLYC